MPATYAHHRFGEMLLEELPQEIRSLALYNKPLYDLGQHGPDIMFYYYPLSRNRINRIGYGMHKINGKKVFRRFAKLPETSIDRDSLISYLIGFVCHFSLDSSCHSYIENKIKVSGVTHVTIEGSLERMLLLKDGKDPIRQRLTNHIIPDPHNAEIITPVFAPAETKHVYKAVKSYVFYNDMLLAPEGFKRKFVYSALSLGHGEGMLIPDHQITKCIDSDMRLEKLFNKALGEAPALIESFLNKIEDPAAKLDSRFDGTFEAWPGWENIPVLSPEEEAEYEV